MIQSWIVWSPMPPECREKVSCSSMFDAARAWADRQFKRGMLIRNGTNVLVRCEDDPALLRPKAPGDTRTAKQAGGVTATTYQVRLTIANAPAFRTNLIGVVYDGAVDQPEDSRG
jgi:hypothetical protein